jgi:hypothetical protein
MARGGRRTGETHTSTSKRSKKHKGVLVHMEDTYICSSDSGPRHLGDIETEIR